MTCEREEGAQRHMMCGNTVKDRLELLRPVPQDWHSLMALVGVSFTVRTQSGMSSSPVLQCWTDWSGLEKMLRTYIPCKFRFGTVSIVRIKKY